MFKKTIASFVLMSLSTVSFSMDSHISVESPYSVKITADRFEKILKEKGLTLFARVDHSKNAKKAGLELESTELLIFGNPKVGTPLMKCSKTVALDLPQKALFWKDDMGKTWLTYNNPEYLKTRHQVKGCDKVFKKISAVLSKLSQAATKK